MTVQKRPTAVIMGDDWYGHRDPMTGLPFGDKDEWIDWDHALLFAFQTIEDFTDKGSGLLAWETDDEYVEVNAIKKINKFQEAVDLKTKGSAKKPYKPEPGEYFIPDMFSRRKDENGEEVFQTYSEWVAKSSQVE